MDAVIANRGATSTLNDDIVTRAVDHMTRPLTWTETDTHTGEIVGHTASVLDQIVAWMDEVPRSGGKTASPEAVRFTVLSILVAIRILAETSRPIATARVFDVLVLEMLPHHRRQVGMSGELIGPDVQRVLAGVRTGATADQMNEGRQARARIYAGIAELFHRMSDTFDPSPYDKRRKTTNRQRDVRRQEKPRIPVEEQTRNRTRLDLIMNMVLAAGLQDVADANYCGDIVFDETIVIVKGLSRGHGTRAEFKHAGDPDAEFWPGKRPDADEDTRSKDKVGFGYGLTFVQRSGRPYKRGVKEIVTGIHIGRPSGGASDAVISAITHSDRFGLIPESGTKYAIADMGYHKNELIVWLEDHGYQRFMTFMKDWKKYIHLPSVTKAARGGTPAVVGGPYLSQGAFFCPGTDPTLLEQLGKAPTLMVDANNQLSEQSRRAVIQHQATLDRLLPTMMPIHTRPRRAKSSSRGRPKTGEATDDYIVTLMCPAVAGQVACLLCPQQGPRTVGLPEPTYPPAFGKPHLQPVQCRQGTTNVRIDAAQLKLITAHPIGTWVHADYYVSTRSSNERSNSQVKNPATGGIRDQWIQVRGVARVGLVAAIQVAVANASYLNTFRCEYGDDPDHVPYSPRERVRRARQYVLDAARESGLLRSR